MIVNLPPEVEKKLLLVAAQNGFEPASFAARLVEERLRKYAIAELLEADADFDPEALKRAVATLIKCNPPRKIV